MPVPSFSLAPTLARVFRFARPARPAPHPEIEALLDRIRHRHYPETIPVLASYWLKTVFDAGHDRAWWKNLNRQLKQLLRQPGIVGPGAEPAETPARQSLIEVQTWIQQSGLLTRKAPETQTRRFQPFRPVSPDRLAPYLGRLLNEWLPAEVAALLIDESEPSIPRDEGIPALAVGKALERILLREHLSPETLERLLAPELLSPRYFYPADAEIFRDVVLALLGRTRAPIAPVLPAITLGNTGDSHLPSDYREEVRNAFVASHRGCEEIHVPITADQAQQIVTGDPVRLGPPIVTMDGRWWQSERLQSGEQHVVVYRPGARLRMDYSADHARLTLPWQESRANWLGAVCFREPFEIFGKEWHAISWETEGVRSWIHLEFSRALRADSRTGAGVRYLRSHPAAIDLAWAALENALAASLAQHDGQAIEQLRHADLIPLGRAILGLAETVQFNRLGKRELVETQLRAIRYFQAESSLLHGRVPFRILPAPVRNAFVKSHPDAALRELLNQVFDELPPALTAIPSQAA
jgi:hypothetical protein